MLLSEFIRSSCRALQSLYPSEEAQSIVSLLLLKRFGIQSYAHILNPSETLSSQRLEVLQDDLSRLLHSEPLQYILGECEFCSRSFKVTNQVLIPRPETEILVCSAIELLRQKHIPSPRVLDLCTGSGCIAWSIALDCPGSRVCATDISPQALEIARSQFRETSIPSSCQAPEFILADLLADPAESLVQEAEKFDLIVSNPPYIMPCEKAQMHSNVLDYEPELALFAPESDPVAFYRAIDSWASVLLKKDGAAIVEINSLIPEATIGAFSHFRSSRLIEDLSARPRFILLEGLDS